MYSFTLQQRVQNYADLSTDQLTEIAYFTLQKTKREIEYFTLQNKTEIEYFTLHNKTEIEYFTLQNKTEIEYFTLQNKTEIEYFALQIHSRNKTESSSAYYNAKFK